MDYDADNSLPPRSVQLQWGIIGRYIVVGSRNGSPMEDEERYVECSEHGAQQETYVCQHLIHSLRTGEHVGFWCAESNGNPRPDAWCDECEKKVQSTDGEWNDESESFAGIRLLCGACYDRVRRMNQGH